MANSFYSPGEQRATKVNDLFATIATRYDLINDLQSFGLHRVWKRRVLRLADPRPGERALDLCCGTGDLALALAGCRARVAGLDFSGPMLRVAEARRRKSEIRERKEAGSQKTGHAMIQPPACVFIKGDAQRIPFPDNSFEIVTIGYGLRNLASWETGLSEMVRVAAPGGRVLVLDFGKPDNPFWRAIYFGYLRCFVPAFGKIFCGNSATHAYIFESLRHYPAQHGVAAKMRELGLMNVRVVNLFGGVMSIHYAEKAPTGDRA
jgi:demethylmenaquinone methyltransferase / 2-methoxy-6-polyprenyl-1,4-benzoquinol methylase